MGCWEKSLNKIKSYLKSQVKAFYLFVNSGAVVIPDQYSDFFPNTPSPYVVGFQVADWGSGCMNPDTS